MNAVNRALCDINKFENLFNKVSFNKVIVKTHFHAPFSEFDWILSIWKFKLLLCVQNLIIEIKRIY